MIERLLQRLGLAAPPPPLQPVYEDAVENEHSIELRKAMAAAERIRRRADLHTEQANRMVKSWDDLLLPGEVIDAAPVV